jgi:hypothetical protein
MNQKRSRGVLVVSQELESLERRIALSGAGSAMSSATAHHERAAEVSALTVSRVATTQTSLSVHTGTLGQPLTITVSVRAAAAAGSPEGLVNILDHGQVITTLAIAPTASTNARFAFSGTTVTLAQLPGGAAYYFGKHNLTAEFSPSGSFGKSAGHAAFAVSQPSYSTLNGGVKIASITQGSGPQIQGGQTANVLYTGYLERNGRIFDDSISHGGTPLSFTLGAGQVVPGFDAGTAGMQAGESRIIFIPPSAGYGSTANGTIPANSTLIFIVTLTSIS